MAITDLNQTSTHDLWVEARDFDLNLTRPTPNTLLLSLSFPTSFNAVDGMVVTVSTTAISANEYPEDGERYVPDTSLASPTASDIGRAHVVAFWSGMLSNPIPVGTVSADGTTRTITITVTDADPGTIYYASVHACTNVLQYYPIGIQSYPLESSRIEKDSNTFTGSIPSFPSAPVAPTPGMVYFDQQLNAVQYWDALRAAWIPTRADTILTGSANPGVPGQVYLYVNAMALKVFNGVTLKWETATATSLKFRAAANTITFSYGFTLAPNTRIVASIDAGSPADLAGVQVNDVVVSIDGNPSGPQTAELLPFEAGETHSFVFSRVSVVQPAVSLSAIAKSTPSPQPWVPLGVVLANVQIPRYHPAPGDVLYNYTTQRVTYWDGATWQVPSTSTTLFTASNVVTVPAFTVPFQVEPSELITPYAGLLFYNTTHRVLNVFDGTRWIQANTDQQGTPTSDKTGIGNDGSYDERIRLIKILKTQLGWPTQCVELTEEHFNVAIDNALDTYRQLSIGGYERRFLLFTLQGEQQTYYLNSPVDQTDHVVLVHKVHRLNIMGATSMNWDSNVYFQTFLSQFYSSGYTDLLSIHLLHSLSDEFQRIFAGDLPFTWNEARRELVIHRRVSRNEKVVIEVEMERTEQELLLDRWCKQFLQNWALAECKEYLGAIRSKYSSGTPGPAGTITLNGETLLAEARQDFTELKEALLNFEYANAEHGNVSLLFG